MRLHPHIWKYFSSRHRLCRICGEPEKAEYYSEAIFSGYWWGRISFETWKTEYPEYAKADKIRKEREHNLKGIMEKHYSEARQQGKAFLADENSRSKEQ